MTLTGQPRSHVERQILTPLVNLLTDLGILFIHLTCFPSFLQALVSRVIAFLLRYDVGPTGCRGSFVPSMFSLVFPGDPSDLYARGRAERVPPLAALQAAGVRLVAPAGGGGAERVSGRPVR